MADSTISNLPSVGSVGSADLIPIVQSGVTSKATQAQLVAGLGVDSTCVHIAGSETITGAKDFHIPPSVDIFNNNGGVLYTDILGNFNQTSSGSIHTVLHGSNTPTFSSVDLTADISNILGIANGGTNSSTTLTNNKIIHSSGGKLVELGNGTSNQLLGMDTAGVSQEYKTLNSGTNITVSKATNSITVGLTGIISVANGGTNSSITLNNNRVIYSSGGSLVELSNGTASQILGMDTTGTVQEYKTLVAGSNMSISYGAGAITLNATGAVSSVSNVDNTLIVSPTTGNVTTSLNLAQNNTWTAPINISLPLTSTVNVPPAFSVVGGANINPSNSDIVDVSIVGGQYTFFTTDLGFLNTFQFTGNSLDSSSPATASAITGLNFVPPTYTSNITPAFARTIWIQHAISNIVGMRIDASGANLIEFAAANGSLLSAIDVNGNFTGNAANVTGIVAIANGGTNSSTTLTNNKLIHSSSGKLVELSNGTANQILGMDTAGTSQEYKTLSGISNISITNASNSTSVGITGIIPISHGGTNSSTTLNNNRVMFSSGGAIIESASVPAQSIIVGGTSSAIANISLGTANQILGMDTVGASNEYKTLNTGTNIALTYGVGSITIGLTGIVGVTNGGTGLSSANQGDILYASGSNSFTTLGKSSSSTRYLANTGSSNNPAWDQINLTNGVTNILPIANGGSNSSATLNNGRVIISSGGALVERASLTQSTLTTGDSVSGIASLALGTANQLLGMDTAGAINEYKTLVNGSNITITKGVGSVTFGVSGIIPVANGGTNSSTSLNSNRIMHSSSGSIVELSNGTANQILGMDTAGTSQEYKTLTAGSNVTITTGAGSVTISAASGGGGVTTVSNTDGTLTISPTSGNSTASLNLAQANAWTGQQNFANAGLTISSSTIAWNLNTQQSASVTLTGSDTLNNPTNLVNGGTYLLRIGQDTVGSRTLSYGTVYKWPNKTAPILTTAASSIDIISFTSDGTNMYGIWNGNFG